MRTERGNGSSALHRTVAAAAAITPTTITATARNRPYMAQIARPAVSLLREAREWNRRDKAAMAAPDMPVRSKPLP
jgi:hypothetical protein